MTGHKTTNLSDAIRNLIVCDTQFGRTGETTLKLPELLDLQARGWLIEGDENNEFSLTVEGEAVIARALQQAVPAELAEQQGVELPPLPEAFEAEFTAPGRSPVSVYTAEQMQDYARAALAATGKQQVGEVQGDALSLADHITDHLCHHEYDIGGRSELLACVTEALAARQPVHVQGSDELRARTDGERAAYLEGIEEGKAQVARQAGGAAEHLDRALGETIDQRDRYHEVADDMAGHIERITGVEIGEHSSDNCPWQNAIEAAECYSPAQGIDLGQVREIRIPARNKLDPISVLVQDQAAGRGRIVVTCHGNAWQAFWGAMGDRTVMEFVAQCDADYVAGNMLQGRQTRIAKHEREYAARVAAEVIAEFRALAVQRDAAPGVGNG